MGTETEKRSRPSRLRKIYFVRLFSRIGILLLAVWIYFRYPKWLPVLEGANFFKVFSPLHLLWGIWMMDMVEQLAPIGKDVALGSYKLFPQKFRPILKEKVNYQALRDYVISTTKSAYQVFILWTVLTVALGWLYYLKVLSTAHLFLVCVFFYVCDLICVLIWCPFRLIMKNRCCTTCRIFNWDHLMMFTPMLFVNSVYSVTLLLMAFAVWVVWEVCVMMYPERFWEQTNVALRCSECTDKLCTQYCQKLRR